MSLLGLFIFPFFMAYAASSDLLTMRISNKIILGLMAGFILLSIIIGMPLMQFGINIGIALIVLVITFILFNFGWIGGGDAKLAAATSLWLGPSITLEYLVYGSFLGGLLTIIILIFRKLPIPFGLEKLSWVAKLHKAGTGVPYGIALAASGLLVYPQTLFYTHLTGQEPNSDGLFFLIEKLLTGN